MVKATRTGSLWKFLWSNWPCVLPVAGLGLVLGITSFFNQRIDLAGLVVKGHGSWQIAEATADLGRVADQLKFRLGFGLSSIVMVLVSLAAIGLAVAAILSSLRSLRSRERRWIGVGAAAVVGLTAVARYQGLGGDWLVGEPRVYKCLRQATLRDAGLAANIDANDYVWLLAYLAFALLLCAASSALALRDGRQPPAESARELVANRTRLARYLLYAGAAVLSVGVVQMHTFYAWPSAWLGEEGESVHQMARAISTANGAFFTLLLLSLYLPAAAVLRARSDIVSRQLPAELPDEERSKWFAQVGLDTSPIKEMTRIIALLAPLLAGGPLGTVLDLLQF